jgi:acetolactate synthase-1/2/3 large subunit
VNSDSQPATCVADTVARHLRDAGIRFAFGMPGGEIVTVIDALERTGIRFVLARNETAAAMMAAGASAIDGVPGLLITTLGPGLANAVNGIADAVQERTPLIVISGVVDRPLRARYTHQIIDHAALLRPLVKASFEIEPHGCASVVARAIRLALASPCGPVHIDLSPAISALPDPASHAFARHERVDLVGVDLDDAAVEAVRQRLNIAERPLIIAGLEAARSGVANILAGIVERHAAPVLTTYKAKGVLDESHPASLGAAGLSPKADAILLDVVRDADLVILAGYDPIEMRPGWLDAFPDPERIVELTSFFNDHGMHSVGRRLVGNVSSLLEAVFKKAEKRSRWRNGELVMAREQLEMAFRGPASWGPHAVFDTLAATLPAGAVVTVDSGAHRILLSQRWRAKRPFELLQSAGWCTMGSALPLAIGAKLTAPGRAVVAVVGDGGLEMTLGELGTLRDQNIPIVVVVLQDESLALIELKQRQARLTPRGVHLGATRFDRVASAFGGVGMQVDSADSLLAALNDAFARDSFTLVSCQIDANSYVDAI